MDNITDIDDKFIEYEDKKTLDDESLAAGMVFGIIAKSIIDKLLPFNLRIRYKGFRFNLNYQHMFTRTK